MLLLLCSTYLRQLHLVFLLLRFNCWLGSEKVDEINGKRQSAAVACKLFSTFQFDLQTFYLKTQNFATKYNKQTRLSPTQSIESLQNQTKLQKLSATNSKSVTFEHLFQKYCAILLKQNKQNTKI